MQQAIFVRFVLFPFLDRLPSHYVLIFFRQPNLITEHDLTDAAVLPRVILKRTGFHFRNWDPLLVLQTLTGLIFLGLRENTPVKEHLRPFL